MSIKIMSRVWEQSSHRGNVLLTLLALADYANDDGVCWPNLARLELRARTKERQLQAVLQTIEESGELFIQRGGGRGHSSLYAVLTGMDVETIESVLITHFDLSPIEAQAIAHEKVRKTAPFLEKVRNSAEKGAVFGPKKVRNSARKGAVFRQEKVQFSAKKEAIQGIGMPRSDSDPSLRSISDPPALKEPSQQTVIQGSLALAREEGGQGESETNGGRVIDLETARLLNQESIIHAFDELVILPAALIQQAIAACDLPPGHKHRPARIVKRARELRDLFIRGQWSPAARPLVETDSRPALAPIDAQADPLAALWQQVQAALWQQVGVAVYETWLKETRLIQLDTQQAIVGTPNIFARDKVAELYAPLILEQLRAAGGDVGQVVVVLDSSLVSGGST